MPCASLGAMYIGIDVGGTKSSVILGLASGEILERESFSTPNPAEAREAFIEIGKQFLGRRPGQVLEAIGCSVPGPMSSRLGKLCNPPNLPAWKDAPIRQWMQTAFGVPVAVENDANAAALAEWRWGHKQKINNLVYFTCGTGMGAGLVLNGALYRGMQDLAGEVGHVRLRPFGPVGFYKAGSLEGFTSGSNLPKLAIIRLAEPHQASVLDSVPVEALTSKVIGEAALQGDAMARSIIEESAGYLGEFIGALIDILNPEHISLGSHALRLGELYLKPVRQSAQREALPEAFAACRIEAAALGESVQDLASLAAALEVGKKV